MSRGIHPSVQDAALQHIRSNATRIAAVLAYAGGDTYATATGAGNIVAQAAITSADMTIADGASGARVLTTASKVDTNTAAGNATHILWLDDTADAVLAWTDETGAVTGTAGGALRINAPALTINQPAQA